MKSVKAAILGLFVSLALCGVTMGDTGMVVDRWNAAFVVNAGSRARLGRVPVGPEGTTGDCVVSPDGRLGIASHFDSRLWIVDLTSNPPRLASGTNPISISNRGRDVAQTLDGRFAVVCDGSAPGPVSIVDIASRVEAGTF